MANHMTDAQARRIAMNVTAQLPANPVDARRVLRHVQVLASYAMGDIDFAQSEALPAEGGANS